MKAKKIIALALATVICVSSLFTASSCAQGADDIKYAVISENNLTDDGLVYSVYENNTIVITGRQVDYDELVIPDEIDGKPVVEIGEYAFENDEGLIFLTLGKNVNTVCDGAFSECIFLARVEANDTLMKICSGAFYACSKLTELAGATKLEYIGETAFYNCASLAYFDFPETLTTLGNEAFSGCESLTKVELPSKLKEVGWDAFSYCTSLTRASMANIKNISERMFLNCISLEKVTVSESVEAIGGHAFRGCSSLKRVYIPKNVTSIGEATFAQCEALTTINYGGAEARFAKIEVGTDNDAFKNASVSYNQKAPQAAQSSSSTSADGGFTFTERTMSDETEYTEGEYKYLVNDDGTAVIIQHTGDELEIVVPNMLGGYPVVEIGAYAFEGNMRATSVTMGDNLEIIRSGAFNDCSELKKVEISKSVWSIEPDAFSGTPWYNSLTEDEFVIVGDSVLLKYNGTDTTVVIPDTVKHTSAAFLGNETIKDVTVPDSVYTIGCATFASSTVSRVELGSNVVLIDGSAFSYCYALHYINIPDSVKQIRSYAFASCAGLNYVKLGKGIEKIEIYAFMRSSQFAYIYFPKSIKSLGDYAFEDCYMARVYYEGTEEEFKAVGATGSNARLTDAKKIYNYNY